MADPTDSLTINPLGPALETRVAGVSLHPHCGVARMRTAPAVAPPKLPPVDLAGAVARHLLGDATYGTEELLDFVTARQTTLEGMARQLCEIMARDRASL